MRRLRLSSNGDTIIEVLIVLAILSLAFAISLATANHGLAQSRNSQEHSQAAGILASQAEELRTAVANKIDVFTGSGSFCMTSSGTTDYSFTGPVPSIATVDSSGNYGEYPSDSSCQVSDSSYPYYESITYVTPATDPSISSPTQDYFDLKVRWDGVGSLGPQQEEMVYKINALTADSGSGTFTSSSTPQIKVVVGLIPPSVALPNINGGDPTPSCSSAGSPSSSTDGTTVAFNDTTDGDSLTPQTINDGSSITLFQDLQGLHNYQATIASVPSGYQPCTSTGSAPAAVGTTNSINLTIRPICTSHIGSYNPAPYWTAAYAHPYGWYPPAWWPPQTVTPDYVTLYAYAWPHGGGSDAAYSYQTSHFYSAVGPSGPTAEPGNPLAPDATAAPNTNLYTTAYGGTPDHYYGYIAHSASAPQPNWFYNVFTYAYYPYLAFDGTYTYADYVVPATVYYTYWTCP